MHPTADTHHFIFGHLSGRRVMPGARRLLVMGSYKIMRQLFTVSVLVVLAIPAYTQQTPPPKCELQELAIDAALGERGAQYDLGVEFYRGESVPRDYAKAAMMWRMASDAGSVEAAN